MRSLESPESLQIPEYEEIKKHPVIGYNLVKTLTSTSVSKCRSLTP